jgi:hypothetical protein
VDLQLWSCFSRVGALPNTPLVSSTSNTSLLLYVDDIILTASSSTLLQHIMAKLNSEFAMTDLSGLHHFLSITVTRSTDGLFLSHPIPTTICCGSSPVRRRG